MLNRDQVRAICIFTVGVVLLPLSGCYLAYLRLGPEAAIGAVLPFNMLGVVLTMVYGIAAEGKRTESTRRELLRGALIGIPGAVVIAILGTAIFEELATPQLLETLEASLAVPWFVAFGGTLAAGTILLAYLGQALHRREPEAYSSSKSQ